MRHLFAFFSFLCTTGGVCGRLLRWTHSTRYEDVRNWSAGRLPCTTDTVVFPANVDLQVVLPKGLQAMKELVLPSDGELVLVSGVNILLSSRDRIHGSCQGQENVWLRTKPGVWLNAANWEGTNSATPDLEKVPCPTDTVEFSMMDTEIKFPPFRVTVAHLNFTKQDVSSGRSAEETTSEFQSINNRKGLFEFVDGDLSVSGEDCSDGNGCECPSQPLQRWICPEIVCPLPSCLLPVKALGDCCFKCGAYLLYGFVMETSLKKVEEVVGAELGDKVVWHVSRTMGYIQVVLRQEDTDQDVDELARDLDAKLINSGLGLSKRSLTISGPFYSHSTTSSPMFLFFFTLFLALVGFASTFYYFERNRKIWPSWMRGSGRFTFARFENLSGLVEIRSTPRTSTVPKMASGFDNPMFSPEGRGFAGEESLLDDEESDDSDTSYDRRTVTTLAIPDDVILEDVPIGKLID